MEGEEGKSLVQTPTWAVASVDSFMVLVGFSINGALGHIEKWLYRTKRKALNAALNKIKEELMLFVVLSLLMGHWIVYAAKICVKASAISSRFYPCSVEKTFVEPLHHQISFSNYSNYSVSRRLLSHKHSEFCPVVERALVDNFGPNGNKWPIVASIKLGKLSRPAIARYHYSSAIPFRHNTSDPIYMASLAREGYHAVLVVGIDNTSAISEQIKCTIKNSHGVGWGENGFTNIGFEMIHELHIVDELM